MYNKWFKSIDRAFYYSFFTFNQVQYIYSAMGIMMYFWSKPMSPCFDKFPFMQAGFFFHPAFTFINLLKDIDQFIFYPIFCPAPIHPHLPMFNVNRSWLAI